MSSNHGPRLKPIITIAIIVAIVIPLAKALRLAKPSPPPPQQTVSAHTEAIEPTRPAAALPLQQLRQPTSPITTRGKCAKPISLKVGQIDEQFALDAEILKNAAKTAADEWNTATGRSLFVIRDNGEVTVNLLFDGRQDSINKLAAEEQEISALSEDLKERIQKHDAAIKQIELASGAWNRETDSLNKRIELLNAKSRTEIENLNEYAALQAERQEISQTSARLKETQRRLMLESDHINKEARELRQEGEALNARILSLKERFPQNVFTEGEHRRGAAVNEINVYTFYDLKEFHVVLLHEMGHALGLPHTEEHPAIMHPLIEHGSGLTHLTSSDVQAALALCAK